MCKSEIFAKIINIVSKETEVSVDQILSSDKNMETVDARYLLVSLLISSSNSSAVMVDVIIINMFYNINNLLLVNSKSCTFASNINDVSRTSVRGLKQH